MSGSSGTGTIPAEPASDNDRQEPGREDRERLDREEKSQFEDDAMRERDA